jgi:hypothetical protein
MIIEIIDNLSGQQYLCCLCPHFSFGISDTSRYLWCDFILKKIMIHKKYSIVLLVISFLDPLWENEIDTWKKTLNSRSRKYKNIFI